MSVSQLKQQIIDAIWRTTDAMDDITSATLTGSFAYSDSLDGLSDIDFVVTLKELDETRYRNIRQAFQDSLGPVLASHGYDLMINSTLGPLKFNAPRLAVLHLMLYTEASHVSHVIQSPFTCLDWQRSPLYRKKSLAEVYPTFGLQPRHFLSARRSVTDYLNDYRDSVVSYREFDFENDVCREIKKTKSMTLRDRHEFAYHVMRFLMINLLKLVRYPLEDAQCLDEILTAYEKVFPVDADSFSETLRALAEKKRSLDFEISLPGLDHRLERFVMEFEKQFRSVFLRDASRHVWFRHAPTDWNTGEMKFQGKTDQALAPMSDSTLDEMESLRSLIASTGIKRGFTSTLMRSSHSLRRAAIGLELATKSDDRLNEIDYGDCEGLTVGQARARYHHLFKAWSCGEDPCFPNGENSDMVLDRVRSFLRDELGWRSDPTVICTHNVVLRTLIGSCLGIATHQWHRLKIPHLTPISFVVTEKFGCFVEMDESVQRIVFSDFAPSEGLRDDRASRECHPEDLAKSLVVS